VNRVKRPEEYKWSSYGANAWGDLSWIRPHEEFIRPGSNRDTRARGYRDLFKDQIEEGDIQLIRQAAHYCHPACDNRFI